MNFNCPQNVKLIRRLQFFPLLLARFSVACGWRDRISLRFNLIRRFAGFGMLEPRRTFQCDCYRQIWSHSSGRAYGGKLGKFTRKMKAISGELLNDIQAHSSAFKIVYIASRRTRIQIPDISKLYRECVRDDSFLNSSRLHVFVVVWWWNGQLK